MILFRWTMSVRDRERKATVCDIPRDSGCQRRAKIHSENAWVSKRKDFVPTNSGSCCCGVDTVGHVHLRHRVTVSLVRWIAVSSFAECRARSKGRRFSKAEEPGGKGQSGNRCLILPKSTMDTLIMWYIFETTGNEKTSPALLQHPALQGTSVQFILTN
jgi:hypothetical protein